MKQIAAFALCVLVMMTSCEEVVKVNHVKDVTLQGKADPVVSGSWRKMGDFFNENAVYRFLFVLKGKAYFKVTMNYQDLETDFWAYDPAANTFSPRKQLPTKDGGELFMAIGEKGYYGPGLTFYNGVYTNTNELWEYNPDSDSWTRKADFLVNDIYFPGIFVIGSSAYVCGWHVKDGYPDFQGLYQYNATTDVWTKKAARYPLYSYRTTQVQLSVNGAGYVFGGGSADVPTKDRDLDSLYLAKYNPGNDSFSKVATATFPYPYEPDARWVVNDKIYFYLGAKEGFGNKIADNEIWEFGTTDNSWKKSKPFNGPPRHATFAFAIGGKVYLAFGNAGGVYYDDIWEFNP